ncbi:hypothetical protein FisN_21Lh094 [Fistulifera solaris]|uniref:Cyclin N-terminal domain-containing protein n=1 Tax=Fistulifera solaris TaxID=1519565 RepID=A0A1Z5KJX8_FISSO|nr:hypothetical protein FisN_21Lh094 [Fistulifera solaris]|eukprot:GAX26624.1 hypothetical protein FisN_21Lh094 [Fistulifera solaris]
MLQQDDVLILESRDSIHKMLALEASMKCGDGEENAASNEGVNSLWRQKVALWCYQVVDHLEEERSTVYVAMNILDRFCSALHSRAGMDEHAYEVASMTALFLAVRIAGSGNLEMSELLSMSRKGISSQDIMLTGTSIIETLDLSKRILTPFDFIASLADHLPLSLKADASRLRDSACYLAEMAVCDTVLSSFKASEVAFVAFVNSIEEMVSKSEASVFGSFVAKATDIIPSSSETARISRRLRGIYQKQRQDSRSPSAQQAEAQPVVAHAHSPLVRVVSVDDLQEFSKQRSGLKRCQSEYSLDEDYQMKRSRYHD